MGLGQRNGFDKSKDEAGRDKVVLARGVEAAATAAGESVLLAAEVAEEVVPPGNELKYDAPAVGDGMREDPGVLMGVLSALVYSSAGGTHPEGLLGSLIELGVWTWSSYAGGDGTVPGMHDE